MNPSPRSPWLVALALVALTVGIYWSVGGHEFIRYDDPDYVTMNAHVQPGLTREGVAWAFGRLHGDFTYWHPLTWISHMIDCELFGLRPGPHHLMNLAFHVANVVLLFFVLRRMTREFWLSALVAALWSIHPLQVDTVAWVTERKNLLSALFWILAMGAYVRYAEAPRPGRYLMVFVAMALGLMAKPILVTLPCVFLLMDMWPLRRSEGTGARTVPGPGRFPRQPPVRLLLEKLPFFALSLASSWITIAAHRGLDAILTGKAIPLGVRLESAVVSYGRYVGKTVVPAGLAVFYPHPGEWPWWMVAWSILLLVGITGGAVRLRHRFPAVLFGWCWFLGALVPTIGILQAGSQSIADRFMYLPLVGLLVAGAWGGRGLLTWLQAGPRAMTGMALGLIAVLAVVSSVQLRHWQNTSTLFAHALAVTERNYTAYAVLGTMLAEQGQPREAVPYLEKALEFKPDHFESRVAYGNALVALQKFNEAIPQYQYALQGNPRMAEAYNGWASALAQLGQLDESLVKLGEALRLRPDFTDAQLNQALVLQRAGRSEEAAAACRELMRTSVTNEMVFLNLGNGFLRERRFTDALGAFRFVLRLNPHSVETLNRVAWILATHPDASVRNGPEALRLATQANALTGGKNAATLNTLAAAYAETGQFDAAVGTARQALQLATATGPPELAAIVQKLLDLYQAGTPYRDQ